MQPPWTTLVWRSGRCNALSATHQLPASTDRSNRVCGGPTSRHPLLCSVFQHLAIGGPRRTVPVYEGGEDAHAGSLHLPVWAAVR
jgi:hypothetical protein